MKRQIIQISTDVVQGPDAVLVIHALCDDGTVYLNVGGEGWNPLAPIPQPPSQSKEAK